MVTGSRYVKGATTKGWPLWRRIISRTANMAARLLLSLEIRDCTSGFKCFRRSALESMNFAKIRSKGFGSLFEINYFCHRSRMQLREVPIQFTDRLVGKSKLSWKMVVETAILIVRLRLSEARVRKDGP